MIRIRPGRSWRHNPAYALELRALTGPEARNYTGEKLLDVLGIEIDGVDIAAGIGEAPVVGAVDELAAAILRVGSGEPAAQATVGPGPTEVVLEPHGAEVRLTLVTLRPPARVLAGGLLVDAVRFRAAALAAAQSLVLDLLDLSPALEDSPLLKRLSRACAALARPGRRRAPEWPPEGAARGGFVVRGGTRPAVLEVRVPPASAARLAARALAPWSPLAPLLGPGSLSLRLGSAPALSIEAPPWLALRELLREAAVLVHGWEAGERSLTFRAAGLELRCDLPEGELRAPGWKAPVAVSPPRLAEAVAAAARAFADRALAPAPGRARDGKRPGSPAGAGGHEEPLEDLRAAAVGLLAHCRDLRSGDLHRAPEAVRAPPPRRSPEPPPLLAGRVRRLLYRTSAQPEVGPVVAGGLHAFAGAAGPALVVQGPAGLTAVDLDGNRLWHRPGAAVEPGSAARATAGDLFATEGEALLRLEAVTGAVRWRRSMKGGAARIWAVPGGCARALESGLSLVRDAGTLAFRARLPEGPPLACAAGNGTLLVQLAGGLLLGLDAREGTELWRRRCGVRAGPATAAGPLALVVRQDLRGARAVLALHLGTGELAWERPLPPGGPEEPPPLAISGDLACTLAGPGVQAVRLSDGAPRFGAALPWGPAGLLCALDEAAGRSSALVAAGPGGSAVRLDERGAALWSHAPGGDAADPLPPLAAGPALLCAGGPAELLDLAAGTVLARPGTHSVDATALLPDLSVALHFRDGALALLRLSLHLSLV